MANLKISQLTTYPGSDNDLRWFVMNDSGETATYKFSGFTSPFKSGDATNSIVPSYFPSSSGVTSATTYVDKLFSVDGKINGTNNNLFIGGESDNTMVSGTLNGLIIGGKLNRLNNPSYDFGDGGEWIIGSRNCEIAPGSRGYYNGILGSLNSTVGFGIASNIIGGQENTNNGGVSSIVASSSSNILGANVDNAIIIASNQSTIQDNSGRAGLYSSNLSSINTCPQSVVIGGNNNSMSNCVTSAFIASQTSTISSKTQAVMIATSGRTASQNYALHTENLVLFNYDNLDFADDTAAAAGGVVLGQVYHNAGALRIRIV